MTKQEEIREGIKELRFKIEHHDEEKCVEIEMEFALTDDDLDRIFKVMSDGSVVIKVDRELPNAPPRGYPVHIDWRDGQRAMLKAGYTAVEPLIEK